MVQAYYMRRGLNLTKESADAAKMSADAANRAITEAEKTTLITQRAVILIESVVAEPHGNEPETRYLLPNSVLVFTLKNYGATVAYNVNVNGRIEFENKVLELTGDPGAAMAPQGSNKWITYSLIAKLTHEDVEKASTGSNLVTYVIDVTYDDAFGKHHKYRATGSFIGPLQGFITGGSTSD